MIMKGCQNLEHGDYSPGSSFTFAMASISRTVSTSLHSCETSIGRPYLVSGDSAGDSLAVLFLKSSGTKINIGALSSPKVMRLAT